MQLRRARLQQKFGEAAAQYDARAQFQHVQTRRVLDAAHMLLPEVATLADIGCGTGYFAHEARPLRPRWNILGADIAYGMCEAARARCHAVNADAIRLPLADASVDGVVSALCYQWVENQPQAFAEVARILKPGGRAIIASLGAATLQELRASAQAAGLPIGLVPMQHCESSVKALRDAGLSVSLSEKRLELVHYPTVAALVESMRAIGAGNHLASAARGLTGPKRWAAMVDAYEQQRMPQGLPATWEHHFFVVNKP
ncbi:MAG: methyltransferase domain-containing protein [Alphaproteobacteria bacterium]|nr:methyltransferase domain-containing protein [Alphaproteobacteria bacterium]